MVVLCIARIGTRDRVEDALHFAGIPASESRQQGSAQFCGKHNARSTMALLIAGSLDGTNIDSKKFRMNRR